MMITVETGDAVESGHLRLHFGDCRVVKASTLREVSCSLEDSFDGIGSWNKQAGEGAHALNTGQN
jgi:hypothetical protein